MATVVVLFLLHQFFFQIASSINFIRYYDLSVQLIALHDPLLMKARQKLTKERHHINIVPEKGFFCLCLACVMRTSLFVQVIQSVV